MFQEREHTKFLKVFKARNIRILIRDIDGSNSPEALWPRLLLLLEGLEERASVEEGGARPGGRVDGVVHQGHRAVETHVALVRPEHDDHFITA